MEIPVPADERPTPVAEATLAEDGAAEYDFTLDWNLDAVPDHLRMTFRVEDPRGRRLGEGKDLAALKAQVAPQARATLAAAAASVSLAASASLSCRRPVPWRGPGCGRASPARPCGCARRSA